MKILFWKNGSNKDAFRQRYIEVVQRAYPHLQFEVDVEYGVKIHGSKTHKVIDIWLERGYEEFRKSPKQADKILSRWLGVLRQLLDSDGSINLDAIYPIIKHRDWPQQQRAMLAQTYGNELKVEYWTEELNAELIIVYSLWTEGFSFPSPHDFSATGKTPPELRDVAMENLIRRVSGQRMVTGKDGLYLVSVGGNLDASLILVDDLWKDARLRIVGAPIIGVPDRNTVIVSDSENIQQVYRAAASVLDLWRTEQYPISPKLFVHRNGKLEELDSHEDDDNHSIPAVDVVDIHAIKRAGGSTLKLIIAMPLQSDPRSVARLAKKLDTYIQFMLSPGIVEKCGTPMPDNTDIEVRIHHNSDAAMVELLRGLTEVIERKGAKLLISLDE